MYNQITSNKRRTALLMAVFTAIIFVLGYFIGQMTGYGYGMLVYAALFSFFMVLLSYFSGDKIALAVSGAKGPIKKDDNPYVYRLIENLTITAGLPMPRIYVINDAAPNAFATGRDPRHASVALTTGLIERLENEELEAVIAHELSHIKNFDIRLMMIVAVLAGIISISAQWFYRVSFFGGRNRDERGGNALFALIGFALIIISPIVAELIKLAISRKREFLADASGALLTRYPEGLARALEKIAAYARPMKTANAGTAHMFISNPLSGKSLLNLFSTHPPIEERIKALRQMA